MSADAICGRAWATRRDDREVWLPGRAGWPRTANRRHVLGQVQRVTRYGWLTKRVVVIIGVVGVGPVVAATT